MRASLLKQCLLRQPQPVKVNFTQCGKNTGIRNNEPTAICVARFQVQPATSALDADLAQAYLGGEVFRVVHQAPPQPYHGERMASL